MIGNLLTKAGLALLRKSAGFGFTAQNAEEIRKFFALHPAAARAVGYAEPSWSGKNVSEYTALNIAAVWRCVQAISQAESSLPLHVHQDTGSGKPVASKHPLDWVLYRQPNPDMTSIRMRQTMMVHVLMWGNAYARIVRRGGTKQTIGLWPITPDRVTPKVKNGERVYEVRGQAGNPDTLPASEVFHIPGLGFDGLQGYSVISMAAQSLGLSMAQDEYTAKFFAEGGRNPYLLKRPTKFKNDQEYQEFRARWDAIYGGSANFHKAPILEGGLEYQELGMPLKDAELLASRQFSVTEICRWFGVQPHLAFDLERSTNNNIEHQGLEFYQQTMLYWLSLWEQEADTQLLGSGEQGTYFVKHNLNALMRADMKTRFDSYGVGKEKGFVNLDRICDLEDWDRLPNGAGSVYHIPLNWQTLPGTGEPTAAERAALAKISQGGGNGTTAS